MDKIILQGLQIASLIGVYDFERKARQPLTLDLTIELDLSKASHSDDVQDTIDYAKLAQQMTTLAEESEFYLLEALAQSMCDFVLANYPARQVWARIAKPNIIANAQSVAVEINRTAVES